MTKKRGGRRKSSPKLVEPTILPILAILFIGYIVFNSSLPAQTVNTISQIPTTIQTYVTGGGGGGGGGESTTTYTVTVPIDLEVVYGDSNVVENPTGFFSVLLDGQSITGANGRATLTTTGEAVATAITGSLVLKLDGIVKKSIPLTLTTTSISATSSEIESWDNGNYLNHDLSVSVSGGTILVSYPGTGITESAEYPVSSKSVSITVPQPPQTFSLQGACITLPLTSTEEALFTDAGLNALRLDCQSSSRWTYAVGSGHEVLGIFSPHRTMSGYTTWGVSEWTAMVDAKVRAHPEVKQWEVCNEITLKQFQAASGQTGGYFYGCTASTLPTLYTNLLKATYEKIKSIDPTLTVVGFSGLQTGAWGWDTTDSSQTMTDKAFLNACINLGALNYCDVVSIHTYPGVASTPPTTIFATIDGHIKEIKALVGAKELWCSEWGISVKNCVGGTTQATWIREIAGVFNSNNITNHFHYTWKDDVYTPTNPMGLINLNSTPKPSYYEYQIQFTGE